MPSTTICVRRAVAAKTSRAYAIDSAPVRPLGDRARASSRRRSTSARCAATWPASGRGGQAPSTVARKLASLRGLLRVQMELGARDGEPRRAAAARPSGPSACRACSRPTRWRRCSSGSRRRRRSSCATGRCSSSPTPRACGPRSSSRSTSSRSTSTPRCVRVEGKGEQTRLVPTGEHALRALERYLARGRGALDAGESRALFLSKSGRRLEHLRRPPAAADLVAAGPARRPGACRGASARPAPLVRHPSAGGRRRPARDPGAARPRQHLDDSGLHSGRVGAASAAPTRALIRGLDTVKWGKNWKPTLKRSSCRTCGGATRPLVTNGPASGSWSPTHRWSSTSPAGWARACPPTSRRPI